MVDAESTGTAVVGTALLLVDFQAGVVDGLGDAAGGLVARVQSLAEDARAAGLAVVHVRTAFRAGHPEVGDGNRLFAGLRAAGRLLDGAPDAEFIAALAPRDDEAVVVKHRIDPFHATDLDMLLRARRAHTVVVAGVVTSGAVLSTVRAAADRDYRVLLVEDCCADRDPELHQVLVGRVLPMSAQITDHVGWRGVLESS